MARRTVTCPTSEQQFEIPAAHPADVPLRCPICGSTHVLRPKARPADAVAKMPQDPPPPAVGLAVSPVLDARPPIVAGPAAKARVRPSANEPPRRLLPYVTAAGAGIAGGVVLGLMLAMIVDSPTREALRRRNDVTSANAGRAKSEAEATRLAGELSAARVVAEQREADLKAEGQRLSKENGETMAAMTGAIFDAISYENRSLDVGVEDVERRLERFAALKFESYPVPKDTLEAWGAQAGVSVDGQFLGSCVVALRGHRDDLAVICVTSPYFRERNSDADGLLVASIVADLCSSVRTQGAWQEWLVRGVEAVSRDRQVCCVQGNIRCTLGITDDAQSLYVVIARP